VRKIIHLDMDCFYAAVEVRDNPALRGQPVAVAWSGPRGVVLTANYEARAFGVHSAMATGVAIRKCPQLILVTPRMNVYREVSGVIREVFYRYTDLVEPLSLDEAYLDVTTPKQGPPSGTRIAELIKQEINEATGLTASAGVSYNKFLAKLASGMNKPNGLTVILPEQARGVLEALPVEAFHGIGPATTRRLHELNIYTGADLKAQTLDGLRDTFGKAGEHFYHIVRGIDERPVVADRPYKSISAETTFEADLYDVEQLITELEPLAKQVEARLEKAGLVAKAVVIKVKYKDFRLLSRRRTLPYLLTNGDDLRREAEKLVRLLTLETGVRLLGVGAEGLVNAADPTPFQAFLFPPQT
jgi:DNA polymerase-4